ncbi:MAG: ABC transporter permease [Bacteroidetes bacterium]|nr:ABC transporter permease [Bacteroidota bacterium]
MFKNYLKVALRGLWKNKFSSVINILGLSIGLSSCLLIGLYIRHELSYDQFQQKGDRIARVIMEYKFDGAGESKAGNFTSTKVGPKFKSVFPEVENVIRMQASNRPMLYRDKFFNETGIVYADQSFFDMFSFKWIEGNRMQALAEPNEIVFTQTAAKRYFGDDDPVGKMVKVGSDTGLYKVTGVIADCPSNSQIKFNFLASFSSLHAEEDTYWDANYTTYLLLKDPSDIRTLQAKLPAFMKKEMQGQGATINYYLEPFKWIHLHSEYDGFEPNNSISYVYIVAVVGVLILIIACFTYINLSTARSIERAREVSVRKVVGAGKGQLFWQFIGESALLCVLAVILSYLIALIALPYFNDLTQRQLQISTMFSLQFIGGVLLVIVLVTIAAGSYPALILSGFDPIKGLKGSFKNTSSGKVLRNSLIVFQFVISVFLIASTFIMQNQLYFIQHKNLGYNREHILVLPMNQAVTDKLDVIKQELKTNASVKSISHCFWTPVNILSGFNMRSENMPQNSQMAVTAERIDTEFLQTMGIQLVAGSNVTAQDMKDVSHDKDNVYHFIINEAAAKALGWNNPKDAIGKRMFLDASRPGFVRGVIKDFNFQSMHYAIKPLVLFPDSYGRNLLVKINGNDVPKTIAFIQSKWASLVPSIPFTYRFLDDDYNKLYSAELRLGTVMDTFSMIAIVLACLGLFGLSSYSIQQRMKEVTIRKILGASVSNLTFVLSKNFIRLSLVAIVVALPVTWYAMHKWLQGFNYRIDMQWWMFAIAALAIVLVVLVTVSFQSVKAAFANPVKNLRTE